jgi:DNA invertase Pin-like site-specific DNA recombinase
LIGTRVPEGSYLLVESLDRLSREEPDEALWLMLTIWRRKVHIVELCSGEIYRHDRKDKANALMRALMIFDRGHGESDMKSRRIGAAWAEKRRNAGTTVVTKKLPGWVRFDEATGTLALVGERAAVIRSIFAMALDGMGTFQIARHLNEKKVESWRVPRKAYRGQPTARRWVTKTVRGILDSISVTGRYQPCKGTCRGGHKRPVPDGPVVENYFPRVVSDSDFEAVRRMRRKFTGKGRRRDQPVDLFAKLIKLPGGRSLAVRRVKRRAPVYAPVGTVSGDGTKWVSFLAGVFEAAMLKELAEVKASDVLPGRASARRVERLARRHEELERLYWKTSAKLDDPNTFDAVHARLSEVGAERARVAAELAEAQIESRDPVSESWGAVRNLAGAVAAGGVEARERLRAHLRRTVEEITVLALPPAQTPELPPDDPIARGRPRLLLAQVHFVGGAKRVVALKYACATGAWKSGGFASTVDGVQDRLGVYLWNGLDLRDVDQASDYAERLKKARGLVPEYRRGGKPSYAAVDVFEH